MSRCSLIVGSVLIANSFSFGFLHSVLARVKKSNVGLAVFAIVWGVVIAGFGMAQQTLLVGDMHWIIRVLHLVIAISAMPIAERLARPPVAT